MAFDMQKWYRLLLLSTVYITTMVFLSFALTMIIGFGYLGFTDTDEPLVCYANSTDNYPIPKNATEEDLTEWNADNVARRFQMLLQIGFYILIIYTSLWVLYYMPCVQDYRWAKKSVFWLIIVTSVVYLGFFLTANVFRFQHSGRVCSGDTGWDPSPLDPLNSQQRSSFGLQVSLEELDQYNDVVSVIEDVKLEEEYESYGFEADEPGSKQHLVLVMGDFIMAYIKVQYAMLGVLLCLFLFFKLWKCVKNIK